MSTPDLAKCPYGVKVRAGIVPYLRARCEHGCRETAHCMREDGPPIVAKAFERLSLKPLVEDVVIQSEVF